MISSNLNHSYQNLTTQKINKQSSNLTYASNFNDLVSSKEIKADKSLYTNSTSFGFKTDNKGFLEPDFNEAAGIPKAVKIHVKTLEQISQYANKTNSGYNPIEAMSKAWNFFSKLVGNQEYLSGERLLDKDDLKTMPRSYNSTGSILGDVISLQYGLDESIAASQANRISAMTDYRLDAGLVIVNFNGAGLAFSEEAGNSEATEKIKNDYKEIIGVDYDEKEPKDKISIGAMFGYFIEVEGISMDSAGDRTQRVKAYYDFLKSGKNIQDFLGAYRLSNLRAEYTKEVSLENIDLANKMFDEFLEEVNRSNREFYQKHQALIDNYDFTKTFERKAKVEFPIGRKLNINI